MMVFPMYSIKDSRVGFMTPTVDQNDASAMRNFEHAVMNIDGLYYSHAEDYDLYRIGGFDIDSGVITPCDPQFVVSAASIKRSIMGGKADAF